MEELAQIIQEEVAYYKQIYEKGGIYIMSWYN